MSADNAAIILSLVSVGIAAFALGWNVYRDVILKPRLKVSCAVSEIHTVGVEEATPTFVVISGTNHGPGRIIAAMIHGEYAPLWRRTEGPLDKTVDICVNLAC